MVSTFFLTLLFSLNVYAQNKSSTSEPCAQVSAMVVPMRAVNPKVTPIIPGELAFNCLLSVPLNLTQALAVINSLMPYVEFQSDLSYKKAPPTDFPYPAIDFVAQLNRITSSLQNGTYPNEHSWQMDVFTTFMSAKDGHLRFAGDLLVAPMRFTRNVSLVSVSMDGTSMPQIYLTDEILAMNSTGVTPSVVTKINGQDAVTFATLEGNKGMLQDPDANYNSVMFNPALDFTPGRNLRGFFAGDGRAGFSYPGPNTTLTFANGKKVVFHTQALILGNFSRVIDGATAFQRFCSGPAPVPAPSAPATPAPILMPGDPTNNNARLKGYPIAQVSSSDGQISGYYLPNSDVGVLAIPGFEPLVPAEFQAVMQTMLAEMKRDGKTKLVIDLQGNGGGIVINGFDAFRQLFPKTQDQTFARQRIGSTYATLAKVISAGFVNFNELNTVDLTRINIYQSAFNQKFDLNRNRSAFASFGEKFGPFLVHGDQFSGLQQNNWNDRAFTINQTTGAGMDVTGYGTRQNFTVQPFAAENIVMLYDGACASTCTLFSEMMRTLGGVKSIALGGRPSMSKIQAIGGVKGAQSLTFDPLFAITQFFLSNPPVPEASTLTSSQKTILSKLSSLPSTRSLDNGINFSDHILATNLQDGTPAQFIREEADCRLFYTPAMVRNVSAMWEAAAGAAFGGKTCVAGNISGGGGKWNGTSTKTAGVGVGDGVKQVEVKEMDMKNMVRAADNARAYLDVARMKGVVPSAEWRDMNGRAVPGMSIN